MGWCLFIGVYVYSPSSVGILGQPEGNRNLSALFPKAHRSSWTSKEEPAWQTLLFVHKHTGNTCCNKLRDESRQQIPEHSQAMLENESQWFPEWLGRSLCKAKGHREAVAVAAETPLAQHLWKSMLPCTYLRKNLAFGTFEGKRKAALFVGYINEYIKRALLRFPLPWLERGSIGCIFFWCTVPVPFHLHPLLGLKNTSASR